MRYNIAPILIFGVGRIYFELIPTTVISLVTVADALLKQILACNNLLKYYTYRVDLQDIAARAFQT